MRHSPDDTLEAMLRRADSTLYHAKAQGRGHTLDARGLRLQVV
jgi:PleD family two-component response regulator